jgi:hypothetical protein
VVEAVEDVHQGRLAGAVLAQQGVDLALLDGEVDAVVRDDPWKPLADPLELEFQDSLLTGRRSRAARPGPPDFDRSVRYW